ncbi:bifunctional 4-hydroxy-2-oxoglutarate aldolase/2-dehydro-3-deoxy-phosphogluconate aldolase [Microbacterium sp.]|jgi:2-dehydro-3-deoxyphosphogluconate aldolase/(4S)-4-hydroxy-2-oxoglutarate aldolase|uniref:bifunctional 4-hydroxy-2-oxoglutarate aldolase/2-dehydro-3-deoxy-phosphogluconate aldolase n=1 Tax=Microbacterium sp. TaxID=51671 RepID=UPI0037C531DF
MNGERIPRSAVLTRDPIVAVLRADHAVEYPPVIDALLSGGVRSIELTLSTHGVFDHLEELVARVGSDGEVGVGTVTTLAEAELAIASNAAFVVTPVMNPDVIGACVAAGLPVYPGGLSPTEVQLGWAAGATAVKIFPASAVGPDYVNQLRGPFPDLQVIPSGGVDEAAAIAWLQAGAVAVSIGGPLIGDAFAGGDLVLLTDRARRLSEKVLETVAARGPA